MKELILGGVRSGKSALAQQRAQQWQQASGSEVVYVATAIAKDNEMANRIARHQEDRPDGWQVIEEPIALADTLNHWASPKRFILVDCLTLWLTNLLCAEDEQQFQRQRQALIEIVPQLPGHIIFVSNEVNMGVVPVGELNRRFCDEAGWLHQKLAQLCQRVTLTVAGLPLQLKGE